MGGWRGGTKGIALGGMARAQDASRGGTGGGGTPCVTRGGGGAALRGERMRRQQEGEWDQEESGRLGGALIDGAGSRWARKLAAGRRR
jgi:hypothetical protein